MSESLVAPDADAVKMTKDTADDTRCGTGIADTSATAAAAAVEPTRAPYLAIHVDGAVCELIDAVTAFSRSRRSRDRKIKQVICMVFWLLFVNALLVCAGVWKHAAMLLIFVGIFAAIVVLLLGLGVWTIEWCCDC
jgi:hypothetical protein